MQELSESWIPKCTSDSGWKGERTTQGGREVDQAHHHVSFQNFRFRIRWLGNLSHSKRPGGFLNGAQVLYPEGGLFAQKSRRDG